MESTFWEPIRNCLVVDSLASHWIFVDFHASCHFYYAICLLFDFQNVQTVSKQFFDKNWEFWLARWKHRDLDKLFRRDYIINDCCIHHLVGLDPLSTANLGRRHLRLPIPVRSLLILRILGKFWTYIYKHGFIHPKTQKFKQMLQNEIATRRPRPIIWNSAPDLSKGQAEQKSWHAKKCT